MPELDKNDVVVDRVYPQSLLIFLLGDFKNNSKHKINIKNNSKHKNPE